MMALEGFPVPFLSPEISVSFRLRKEADSNRHRLSRSYHGGGFHLTAPNLPRGPLSPIELSFHVERGSYICGPLSRSTSYPLSLRFFWVVCSTVSRREKSLERQIVLLAPRTPVLRDSLSRLCCWLLCWFRLLLCRYSPLPNALDLIQP